jgi:hypothetical protein
LPRSFAALGGAADDEELLLVANEDCDFLELISLAAVTPRFQVVSHLPLVTGVSSLDVCSK